MARKPTHSGLLKWDPVFNALARFVKAMLSYKKLGGKMIRQRKPRVERGENVELERIQIYFPAQLYDDIRAAVNEAKEVGDYEYITPSDVVREALHWYLSAGKPRDLESVQKGAKKKVFPVLLPPRLYELYSGFPSRVKSELSERIIRTFLVRHDKHIAEFLP